MSKVQFSVGVEIKRPIDEVLKIWQDPAHLEHWQEGFIKHEFKEGEPGEVGSKTSLWYKSPGGKFELVETILVSDLPREFTGEYAAKTMVNTMRNHFTSIDPNTTRWEAHIDYLEFNGIIPKLLGMFGKGMFRKQTQKWLDRFRDHAESVIPQ